MTLRDMRRAGMRAVFSRRWFGRAMFVTAVFCVLQSLVAGGFAIARRTVGFSTWNDFMTAKLEKMRAGLDFVVPSRAVALNLTYATAFELFVSLVFAGILYYGMAAFALRMVRDEAGCGHAAGAFGGFARPLGLMWLAFRWQLQIVLWSLLFLVPGVIAYYRYRAAWYLKAENPDWPAGKCLSESGRVMSGHKGRCFALDCSYWLIVTLMLVLVSVFLVMAAVASAALSFLSAVSVFFIVCLAWCIHAGQTVFYLSIKTDNKESQPT